MTCEACAAALKNKFAALVLANCPGCRIRSVSNATSAARARYIEKNIEPKHREQFSREVDAELRRRLAMP